MVFFDKIEIKSLLIQNTIKPKTKSQKRKRLNGPVICTMTSSNERYLANREICIKQAKLRYQAKREELNTKYACACGGRYAKQNKPAHLRSQKHQKYETFILECIQDEEILYQVK